MGRLFSKSAADNLSKGWAQEAFALEQEPDPHEEFLQRGFGIEENSDANAEQNKRLRCCQGCQQDANRYGTPPVCKALHFGDKSWMRHRVVSKYCPAQPRFYSAVSLQQRKGNDNGNVSVVQQEQAESFSP